MVTTTTELSPGIHEQLGMRAYHAWELDPRNLKAGPISCSVLKDFAINPYAWRHSPPRKVTAAMQTGSLFDLFVTDPDSVAGQVVVHDFPNWKTKAAREWRDDHLALGKLVVNQEEFERADKAARAVRDHPIAGQIVAESVGQVGVVGEIGGIPAKCLLDLLPFEDSDHGETIFDYKTTSTGLDDESIRKTMGNFRYHWQAAFYRTMFNKVSADRHIEDFGFIFQDVTTLEVRVVMLSDDALMLGAKCVGVALKEFVRCAHQGIRSRYLSSSDSLDLMPYHSMNEDEWAEGQNDPEHTRHKDQ